MHFPYFDSLNPAFDASLNLPQPLAQRLQDLRRETALQPANMIPQALLFARVDPNTAPGAFSLLMNDEMTARWKESPTYALDLRLVRFVYRAKFAYLANAVTSLLNLYSDKTLQENTVVIIDGDHGEGFMEHGAVGHANELYNEFIRSLLMVRFPNHSRGTTISAQLEKAGAAALVQGILEGDVDANTLPAWVGAHTPQAILSKNCSGTTYSVTTSDQFKYIHRFADGSRELYDLSRDPLETDNIVSTKAALAQELEEYILLNSRAFGREYQIANPDVVESCARD